MHKSKIENLLASFQSFFSKEIKNLKLVSCQDLANATNVLSDIQTYKNDIQEHINLLAQEMGCTSAIKK